jgi:pimeloyl-ACP methyl ester carboxylesterase
MIFRSLVLSVSLLALVLGCSTLKKEMNSDSAKSEPSKTSAEPELKPNVSGYAPINGIKMYYEIYGKEDGVPLVLLHGGGSTIESTFGKVIPILAKSHRLIAIEEQAHGRTSDRNQPLRFDTSAEDVAALLKYLEVEKADLFGFSNGASVAMYVAIQHPEKVRKLVYASSITKRSGAQPQLWDFIKKSDFSQMPQPLKDAFLKVNPDPAKLKVMHAKTRERMVNFEDISDKDVRSIKAETLILMGDRDVGRLEHAIELSRMIPKARLMVLPYSHGDYMGEASSTQKESNVPLFTMGLIEDFLTAH